MLQNKTYIVYQLHVDVHVGSNCFQNICHVPQCNYQIVPGLFKGLSAGVSSLKLSRKIILFQKNNRPERENAMNVFDNCV